MNDDLEEARVAVIKACNAYFRLLTDAAGVPMSRQVFEDGIANFVAGMLDLLDQAGL